MSGASMTSVPLRVSIAYRGPVSVRPLFVVCCTHSVFGSPIRLPSFFHVSQRVPLASRCVLASIEPPRSDWQISGPLPCGRNGPVGLLATATPMHSLLIEGLSAV
ncbi:hypothetical protein JOD67_005051 [Tenggerimyces flavus]|nr:hypothetical protein [Tenggerimyces flavus]